MDVKSAEPNANCGALFTSTSAGKKAGIVSELQNCGGTTHDFNSFFLRKRKCIKEQKKYSELIDIDRMRSVVPGMVDSGLLVVGFITMVKSR